MAKKKDLHKRYIGLVELLLHTEIQIEEISKITTKQPCPETDLLETAGDLFIVRAQLVRKIEILKEKSND